MECRNCDYWERLEISDTFLKEDEVGRCRGLLQDNVDIELETGMDGGYISSVETNGSFFCANYIDHRFIEKDS